MDRPIKDIYKTKAVVLKALAHPTRLWMVEELAKGPRCVCEFVAALDVDFSTVSKHLSILKGAGLVEDEKQGRQVSYRLTTPCVVGFLSCVEEVMADRGRKLMAGARVRRGYEGER